MGHAHDQSTAGSFGNETGLGFRTSVVILIVQLWGSVLTGSLALLGDTAHIAVDSSGLVIAFITAMLIKRPASSLHSWGLQRLDVVAAFVQASILIVVELFSSLARSPGLQHPHPFRAHCSWSLVL
jgi:cobalt-zinc-cadmium efflux system protein